MKPATTPTQRVDDFGVRVDPETRLHQHLDYFGTTVIEFGISEPHEHLSIDVRARVRDDAPPDAAGGDVGARSRTRAYRAAAGEFLLPVRRRAATTWRIDELVGLIRADDAAGDAAQRCVELIPDRFEYRAGVTYVGSTVERPARRRAPASARTSRTSRCCCCAATGSRARYVSGYLCAPPERRRGADSAEVETHAWIEALLPGRTAASRSGSRADPTNRALGGERHVKIGHGRHYADVPPIKGVYRGAAGAELDASVRMTAPTRPAPRLIHGPA